MKSFKEIPGQINEALNRRERREANSLIKQIDQYYRNMDKVEKFAFKNTRNLAKVERPLGGMIADLKREFFDGSRFVKNVEKIVGRDKFFDFKEFSDDAYETMVSAETAFEEHIRQLKDDDPDAQETLDIFLSELESANRSFGEFLRMAFVALDEMLEESTQISEKLKRAYGAGLSKSTNAKRAAQFKKQAKMDDDNPAAYKPAPGDKRAKTKPSKHTQKFKQMFGESDLNEAMATLKKESSDAALKKKAKKTGMSLTILRKVFNRGVAAWRTGHRPGTNPTQWGLARVNSFTTKSKGTWGGADKDLAAKVRKSKKESVNEVKTNKFTLNDMDDNDAAVVAAMAKKAGVFLRTRKVSMKRSDVELKGDKKKLFKFINSLPESFKEYKVPSNEAVFDKRKGYQLIKKLAGKNIEIMLYKIYPAVGKMHDGIIPGKLRIINPNLFQVMNAKGMKGAGLGDKDRLSFRIGDVDKIDKNKIYLKPEYKPPYPKK